MKHLTEDSWPLPGDPVAADVMICVSPSDAAGLFTLSLELLVRNLACTGRIHVVTPVPDAVAPALDRLDAAVAERIDVWADHDVCPEGMDLDPWFRQQFLKLHADRISSARFVVCLGADTLIVRPLSRDDLLDAGGRPFLNFFRYRRPQQHLYFERQRVLNVAAFLGVQPRRSFLLGDFICDLFVFDAEILRSLRGQLVARGGLAAHLGALGARAGADNRFGEWTTYAVYLLDLLGGDHPVRLAPPSYFRQIHSAADLKYPDRYDAGIVHFAHQPGGLGAVLHDLTAAGVLAGADD